MRQSKAVVYKGINAVTQTIKDDRSDDDDDDHSDDLTTGPPLGWLMTMTGNQRTESNQREYLDAPLPPAAPPTQMLLSL